MPVPFAKYLHMSVRLATIGVLALVIFGTCILFILSIVQPLYPNAGLDFKSGETEHYAYNKDSNCSSDSFSSHRPLRFMYDSQKNQTERYEYCAWRTSSTWWRSISTFIVIFVSIFLIQRLGRRTPASNSASIWQNPKRVLKFLLVPAGACVFVFLILLIVDGSDVNKSRQWCLDEADKSKDDPITCDYIPFILVVLLEAALLILYGVVILLIVVRTNKHFLKYMQVDEDDDDYGIPMETSKKKTTKVSLSALTKKFSSRK